MTSNVNKPVGEEREAKAEIAFIKERVEIMKILDSHEKEKEWNNERTVPESERSKQGQWRYNESISDDIIKENEELKRVSEEVMKRNEQLIQDNEDLKKKVKEEIKT